VANSPSAEALEGEFLNQENIVAYKSRRPMRTSSSYFLFYRQ
jgi:hypothetical protein